MGSGWQQGTITAGLAAPGRRPAAPGSVFVPVHELPRGDRATCELRALTDGRTALLVYGTADELVACCGSAQPWMEVLATRIEELRIAAGADVILGGVTLPVGLRHPVPASRPREVGGEWHP